MAPAYVLCGRETGGAWSRSNRKKSVAVVVADVAAVAAVVVGCCCCYCGGCGLDVWLLFTCRSTFSMHMQSHTEYTRAESSEYTHTKHRARIDVTEINVR